MKDLFQVWKQEYVNIFSDTGVLLIFLGAILIYPFFYPIPYADEVLKEVPIAVVDLDRSQLSRRLIRMVDASELVTVRLQPGDLSEARMHFFQRDVQGVLLIPRDFSQAVRWGEQARVIAYTDASYFLFYRQVLTGVLQSISTMSAGVEVQRMLATGLGKEQALAARDPLPVISYPLYNRSGGYSTFVIPAVLILILQQTLLIGIGMLGGTTSERGGAQDSVARVGYGRRFKVILGKTGAYFSLYLIHSIYFFGILFRLYRFPGRAELVQLLVFVTPFLLAVIFLGIALSALFRNREISIMVLLFTSIPILFLSGFSWPPEAMPGWLYTLAYLLPSTAGIGGFLKLNLLGASFQDVRFDWLCLWGLAIGYFLLAIFSMRNVSRAEAIV